MTLARGEIYWVEFDPVKGSEQGGRRPALIIQNDVGNRFSSTTVVAGITRTIPPKPYPFVVIIEPEESGLPESLRRELFTGGYDSVFRCGKPVQTAAGRVDSPADRDAWRRDHGSGCCRVAVQHGDLSAGRVRVRARNRFRDSDLYAVWRLGFQSCRRVVDDPRPIR